MRNDLKLLLRLHEVYEAKLFLVSADVEGLSARKGYKHEYSETKAILNLLDRLIREQENE